jgi:hypothetical protein
MGVNMGNRTVVVEGWKFWVVYAVLIIIMLLATIGAIAVVVLICDAWPMVAGTGAHKVKMTWR